MQLNRAQAIERLGSGDTLKSSGNTMMFDNGDFCTAATDIWLRESPFVIIFGDVGHEEYRLRADED
uniref:Uncharacterized protein n=1 Tax=viral metagenome TaxID=1070528 RepID=A0A6M3LD10_9ZZZZ